MYVYARACVCVRVPMPTCYDECRVDGTPGSASCHLCTSHLRGDEHVEPQGANERPLHRDDGWHAELRKSTAVKQRGGV